VLLLVLLLVLGGGVELLSQDQGPAEGQPSEESGQSPPRVPRLPGAKEVIEPRGVHLRVLRVDEVHGCTMWIKHARSKTRAIEANAPTGASNQKRVDLSGRRRG
jgi:hypothetical protein